MLVKGRTTMEGLSGSGRGWEAAVLGMGVEEKDEGKITDSDEVTDDEEQPGHAQPVHWPQPTSELEPLDLERLA